MDLSLPPEEDQRPDQPSEASANPSGDQDPGPEGIAPELRDGAPEGDAEPAAPAPAPHPMELPPPERPHPLLQPPPPLPQASSHEAQPDQQAQPEPELTESSEPASEPMGVERPQVNPDAESPAADPQSEPWQPEPIEVDRPQVYPEAAAAMLGAEEQQEFTGTSAEVSSEAAGGALTPAAHPLVPSTPPTPPPLPVAVYPPGHPWAGYPVLPDGQSPFAVATIPQGPPPVTERTFWNDALIDSGIVVALILGFTFLTMLGVGVALLVSGNFNPNAFDLNSMPPPLLWLLNFLMFGTQLAILGVAAWRLNRNKRAGRPNPKLFGGDWVRGIAWGIPVGLAAQAGAVVYSTIAQTVFGTQIESEQVQMIQEIARNGPALVVLAFLVTIMAPIGEELFFRGAVFGSARASGFASTGATISAMLFAVAHLNLVLAPYYALVALVLCWLFSKTRTLAAPIAAHFALNASAVIITVLTLEDNFV